MKDSAIQSYANKLNKIAENASRDFGAEIYPKKIFSVEGISVALLGNIAELYSSLVRGLLNKAGWGEKFSEKYIEGKLNSLIAITSVQKNFDQTKNRLKEIDDEYLSFSTEYSVLIPIFGLIVSKPINIGKVEFLQLDGSKIESVLGSLEKIILSTRHTDEEKKKIIEDQNRTIFSKFLNAICAHVKVVAEPTRAKEIAEFETQRSLDLLRFSIPAIYPPSHKISVGLWGEVARDMRISLVFSGCHFTLDHQLVGPLHSFKFDSENISHMERIGVFRFSQILNKPDSSLTDFEKTMLRSLHWFANSLRQDESENAFLNLITSLEALLTPRDGNPIGTAIAEGCAFLLSKDIQSRKRVKRKIKELYGFRSGVSHGGKKAILDADLIELRAYWMAILSKLSDRVGEWNSQKDFLDWIEDQKFESSLAEQSH